MEQHQKWMKQVLVLCVLTLPAARLLPVRRLYGDPRSYRDLLAMLCCEDKRRKIR